MQQGIGAFLHLWSQFSVSHRKQLFHRVVGSEGLKKLREPRGLKGVMGLREVEGLRGIIGLKGLR